MKVFKDLVAPAVVTDLVSRLISFLTSQYVKRTSPEGTARRLQLLTFKIHAVVDEAQQRDLANNQRLLVWVRKLIEGMYLAYYMLDITTHNVDNGGRVLVITSSFSIHMSRPTKRAQLIGSDDFGVDQLSAVLRRLEVAAVDLKEFILLLACCPRIPRSPIVSSIRFSDKIMFSRFAEREQIISFLLQPVSNLGVLPIVGSPEIGKGTMIKHVCSDERVRGHFAVILYSYGFLLVDENCGEDVLRTLRIGGHVLHESSSTTPGHDRYLVVIKNTYEVVISRELWATLCESLRFRAPGSKVIVFSENNSILDLGTTMAMHVKPLPREEYWYFFKSLAFGGNDPEEHPELAVLGMQIAAALKGSFFGAKVLGSILLMSLNTQFWQGVLDVVQSFHETVRGHDDHFSKLDVANIALKTLPLPLRLKSALKIRIDDLELLGLTVKDMLQLHSTAVPHREEMKIVLWESANPPNYQYTVVCEKMKANHPYAATERKKRARQP